MASISSSVITLRRDEGAAAFLVALGASVRAVGGFAAGPGANGPACLSQRSRAFLTPSTVTS